MNSEYRKSNSNPSCCSTNLKSLLKREIYFAIHLLISLPIFIIIITFLICEAFLYSLVRFLGRLIENCTTPTSVRRLIRKCRKTEDFSTYRECVQCLDELTGRDAWKHSEEVDPNISDYDAALVRRKRDELIALCKSSEVDVPALVKCIKTCIDTQLCNTLNPSLYSMSYFGTKILSEQLQAEVVRSIEFLLEFVRHHPHLLNQDPELFSSIIKLSDDFGMSGLILSGGAMLGLHHFGLVETLIKSNLLPKIICGTSAGSAIAAFVCTRSDEEILRSIKDPETMALFHAPFKPNNWIARFVRYLLHGYSMDVDSWLERSQAIFGLLTFQESFELTGRILNISLSRAGAVGESLVLNYQNAPNVLIFSAVVASSGFPFLGVPLYLQEKDKTGNIVTSAEYHGRYFQDGSLRGDVPCTSIRNRYNVKFIIVSQVNPHVFPFLDLRAHGTPGAPVRGWGSNSVVWRGGFPLAILEVALKEHLRFLLRVLALLKIVPKINGCDVSHLALQSYGGDINIYPSRFYWPHIFLMNNVPASLLEWFVQVGRQMTFPRLFLLQPRILTENALRRLSLEISLTLSSSRSSTGQGI